MASKIDTLNKTLRDRIRAGQANLWSHGNGLNFALSKTGKATFVFKYTFDSKRRVMMLGPYNGDISDRDFKQLELSAIQLRDQVRAGIDPLASKPSAKTERTTGDETFEDVAKDYIATHRADWRNEKHAQQWENTLTAYVYSKIGRKLPHAITVDDVLGVLKQPHMRKGKRLPLWDAIPETARRIRNRIEIVIGAGKAKALGSNNPQIKALWKDHHNPAKWEDGLVHLLGKGKRRQSQQHHPAMPFNEVPAFVQELRNKTDYSSKALLFTILTAVRSSEALFATWDEIDIANAIWIIPAGRMKAGSEHRVALSSAAIELLNSLHRFAGNPYVFPGAGRNKPLCAGAMLGVLRNVQPELTVHGFRSSFRDWCSETTLHPDVIAEMALGHTQRDAVVKAYRRGDAIDRRKQLMQQWADFLLATNDNDYRNKWERFVA